MDNHTVSWDSLMLSRTAGVWEIMPTRGRGVMRTGEWEVMLTREWVVMLTREWGVGSSDFDIFLEIQYASCVFDLALKS
jgi:hypothetical protein